MRLHSGQMKRFLKLDQFLTLLLKLRFLPNGQNEENAYQWKCAVMKVR